MCTPRGTLGQEWAGMLFALLVIAACFLVVLVYCGVIP